MRIAIFCHSILSDWNHGNAHFYRGVASELVSRGHETLIFETSDAWSLRNLLQDGGAAPLRELRAYYPSLRVRRYDERCLDLDRALEGVQFVLVHEWNSRDLVRLLGEHRARARSYRLLFHDTHHRAVSEPGSMAAFDLSHYDGVLAFGGALRDLYLRRGWTQRAWTWHEAADTRVFRPMPGDLQGDLVWIGNWGDEERTQELREYLLEPVRTLGLRARVHGVRYPETGLRALEEVGAQYAGWLPNYRVPETLGRFRVTVHVPRRPYVQALPGVPTIRVFEALACGIPLISAPWEDVEGLFTVGRDLLMARSGDEMVRLLRDLLHDGDMARELSRHGLQTIYQRHTCAHRVDQLLGIYRELESGGSSRRQEKVRSSLYI